MSQQKVAQRRDFDGARVTAARCWGISTILAACFGLTPAVVHLVRYFGHPEATVVDVGAWVYVLLLASGIQVAYAVYVLHLPDWSAVWVAALVSLFLAASYAMFAGVALLSNEQSRIILGLGLNEVRGRKLAGWCLVMLIITGLLAYVGGQMSVRWQRHQTAQRGVSAPRS